MKDKIAMPDITLSEGDSSGSGAEPQARFTRALKSGWGGMMAVPLYKIAFFVVAALMLVTLHQLKTWRASGIEAVPNAEVVRTDIEALEPEIRLPVVVPFAGSETPLLIRQYQVEHDVAQQISLLGSRAEARFRAAEVERLGGRNRASGAPIKARIVFVDPDA